jgi:hypothetical protein
MTPREPEQQLKQRRRLLILFAVAIVVVWILWTQWDALRDALGVSGGDGPTAPAEVAAPSPDAATQPAVDSAETARGAEQRWAALMGRPPSWPEEFAEPRDCAEAEADLARLCVAFDSREYVANVELPGGVCGLIQQTADELAARPPRIASELKSYEAILSNVFHLFRVLGRERMQLLLRLVAEEDGLSEPAAMTLYRWLVSRESCARSGRTPVRRDALYDYGTFLFQTMGGQAYLRRRTPGTEALASFYALLLIDRAVEQNHNPHGIDLRREIRRTRELVESEPLLFRERYLAQLEQLAARWESRGN